MVYQLFGLSAGNLAQYFSHAIAGLKSHSHFTSKWIINNTFLGFNLKICLKKSIFQRLKTFTDQFTDLHRPINSLLCLITGRKRPQNLFFPFAILT